MSTTEGSQQRSGSPTASVATSGGQDIRRVKTRMVDEITEQFQEMGISIGDPHMEEKKPAGIAGERIRVCSNVYGIKMAKIPVFRYDITLSGNFRGRREGKQIEFTKRSKDDSVIVDRKNMCRVVFETMIQKHTAVFGDPKAVYYDLQCILFTLQSVDLGPSNEKVFSLDQEDCTNVKELQRFGSIDMLVRKVRDGFQLTLGDLSHLNNDTTAQNHSLAQFIELATSQCPLFDPAEHLILGGGTSFLLNPGAYGFVQNDGPNLSEGKYLAIGAHKSVRYVEGPKGRGNKHVGLIVETKKTPFHMVGQTLMDKAISVLGGPNSIGPGGAVRANDTGRLRAQIKTLHVEVPHRGRHGKDVTISGVVEDTAESKTFEVNGEQVSVAAYFLRKYDIKLQYPRAPLATAKERMQLNFYPMELCIVKDNQRAGLNQLNSREVATMIRACAVTPNLLKTQIERNVNALHLLDSQYLENAQMKILGKPLCADARILRPPTITYKNGNSMVKPDGKWDLKDSFLVPASIKRWCIYMIPNAQEGGRARFTFENLVTFTKMFIGACRQNGMTVQEPLDSRNIGCTAADIDNTMKVCAQEKCDFVFFVTSDAITNLHNVIKSCEQFYGVVTQDLKMNNAFEIITRGKHETVKNIVCKANEKMGGLNYSVTVGDASVRAMINDGTLFLGLGVSHPGGVGGYERAAGRKQEEHVPSVIGWAANIKKDPFDLIGDFVFDEPRRDEKFSTIAGIVTNCVERYRTNNGKNPTRLVIYRNGTSEGQFGMSLSYEVPLIHHALKAANASECKLTLLVSQKAHNIRLFTEPMETRSEIQLPNGRTKKINLNIKPGTVIDAQLTHPEFSEFYLNSHLAIQGTARTPRYSILVDENKFSMDMLEGFTYALSYAHQIINSPTSLPSPAYIALMYAKRGRALATESRKAGDQLVFTDSPNGPVPNWLALSNQLSYSVTQLADQRVNA